MTVPQKELIPVIINGLILRIEKSRYQKLNKNHMKVIKDFDNDNIGRGNNERTRENQIQVLISFATKTGKDFDDIAKEDINDWIYRYKGATIEYYKILIKKFFKWLGKAELIQHLKAKTITEKYTSEDMLTEDEVLALITACDTSKLEGIRDQCIVAMMYDLLLEKIALYRLKIEHIIEKKNQMKVKVTGKVRGKVKTVVLEPIMSIYYIREWLKVHPQRTNPKAPLFVSFSTANTGQKLGEAYPWQLLKKLRKLAGIKKRVTPHLLRHSKATDLYRKKFRGIPLQRAMRHSSILMQQRYAHLCDEDVNDERYEIETGIPRKEKSTVSELLTINCPRCNTENPPSNVYCKECEYTLNPEVNMLENMILKFLRSALYKEDKEITREYDIEMLSEKYNQLLQDQKVVGRKQVTIQN